MVTMVFKRNQVEDAISRLVEPKARRPSARLRTRLKRLLEADRTLGRSPRSTDPIQSRYAFFKTDPPGRGVEVQFSDYDGFALFTALQMMQHGWTQNVVVSILRRARSVLELHHARILRRGTEERGLRFESETPILVIITSAGTTPDVEYEAFACAVREGYRKAIKWTWDESKPGHGFSMFEIGNNALRLAAQLADTEPRHRGRPG
jgi:hypothetical protein